MSVSYKREINHNYLIIDASEQAAAGYECRMLAGNTIEGLLKFRVRYHEDKREFYYEITSKQPLSRLLEQRSITGAEIRTLILSISGLVGRLEEYLLLEDQIFLEPEYIYIDPDCFAVFFCMVPGYSSSFPAALTALFEYLLSKVNHQDKDGVMLAYNLYHESLKENYGMQDLLGFLAEKTGGIFSAEESGSKKKQDEMHKASRFAEESELCMEPELYEEAELYKEPEDTKKRDTYRETGKRYGAGRKHGADESYDTGMEYGSDKRSENGRVEASRASNSYSKNKRFHIRQKTGKTIFKIISSFALMAVAGEAAVWFLMGTEGLLRYGVWILAGILVLGGISCVVRGCFTEEKRDEMTLSIENPGKDKVNIGQSFKIVQKEEQEEHWTDWEESDKMEKVPEPQTALLADLDKPNRLAVMEGLSREQESIEITYLPFVIGKHEELSDYCLRQPTVSRLHLRVDKKEDVYIVTDLNSTNGTTVDGYHLQANETVSIKNGDIIYLADTGFRFINDKM